MNTTYKFSPVTGSSTVAGLVTVLVSAWFLVAAAAIFADPSKSTAERAAPTEVAAVPTAYFKITVEAPRLKS